MRAWRRSGESHSRLTTRRGEWPTAREWLSLPLALFARMKGRSAAGPWMAPSAVRFLDATLSREDVVVELGGGASTCWLAARAARVYTLEPDPQWARRITSEVPEHVAVIVGPIRNVLQLDVQPDVVIIDHHERAGDMSRAQAARWAADLSPRPRVVVLDDSDRPEYAGCLDGFDTLLRFRGFRPDPIYLTETTIAW